MPLKYKNQESCPAIIKRVLQERGWLEADEADPQAWNLIWRSGKFKPSEYALADASFSVPGKGSQSSSTPPSHARSRKRPPQHRRPAQNQPPTPGSGSNRTKVAPKPAGNVGTRRVNHFPKSGSITRKDHLLRNMRKMASAYRQLYGYMPETYMLPAEYLQLVRAYADQQPSMEDEKKIWICKPADSSRGRGIFLVREVSDIYYDQPMVVQEYLERPLLIGGYKSDLRIYVLVTSVHPLEVHVFRNGLVRFGTHKYGQGLENLFSHLTNSSINKYSEEYGVNKNIIGEGCKWDLGQLRAWLEDAHRRTVEGMPETGSSPPASPNVFFDYETLWKRIEEIVILTLLVLVQNLDRPCKGSFELFGFDVLIDADGKPWLIEVNSSPALGIDCAVDRRVKDALIREVFNVLKFREACGTPGDGAPRTDQSSASEAFPLGADQLGGLEFRPPKSFAASFVESTVDEAMANVAASACEIEGRSARPVEDEQAGDSAAAAGGYTYVTDDDDDDDDDEGGRPPDAPVTQSEDLACFRRIFPWSEECNRLSQRLSDAFLDPKSIPADRNKLMRSVILNVRRRYATRRANRDGGDENTGTVVRSNSLPGGIRLADGAVPRAAGSGLAAARLSSREQAKGKVCLSRTMEARPREAAPERQGRMAQSASLPALAR